MKKLLLALIASLFLLPTFSLAWGKNTVWVDHDNDQLTPDIEMKLSNKAFKLWSQTNLQIHAMTAMAIEEREIRAHKLINQITCVPPEISSGAIGNSAAGIMIAMTYNNCVSVLVAGGGNSYAAIVRATNGNSESGLVQYGRSLNKVTGLEIVDSGETKRAWLGAGIQLASLGLAYSVGKNNRNGTKQEIGDNNTFNMMGFGDTGSYGGSSDGSGDGSSGGGSGGTGNNYAMNQMSIFGNLGQGVSHDNMKSGFSTNGHILHTDSGIQGFDLDKSNLGGEIESQLSDDDGIAIKF